MLVVRRFRGSRLSLKRAFGLARADFCIEYEPGCQGRRCCTGRLGEPLRDPEYFRQVRVDDEARTALWPNGLDPAPELLHGDCEPAVPEEAHSQASAVSRAA